MTLLLDLIREFGLAFVFVNVLVDQVGLSTNAGMKHCWLWPPSRHPKVQT